jgi:tetratricopeptide (TPR) repeat protein
MKRIAALILSLSLGIGISSAQKNERTNAYINMSGYVNSKDKVGDAYMLDRAKAAIDKATVHPDTKDDAKTWVYRGQIYILIYQKEFADKVAAHKDVTDPGKKSSLAYIETSTTNLVEATNAFLRAKALDGSLKVYVDELKRGLYDCYFALNNTGISRFNQKQFGDAYPMFELAADITASDKKFDTLNTSNAALSAYNAKMYDQSIKNYTKLTDAGYGKGATWMFLGRAYLDKGDSAKYVSIISEGLKKYPNDEALLTEDVNLKMRNGQAAAAIDELNALIAQRPNDSQLNLVVGQVYDHLANPEVGGKQVERPKNFEEMFSKAEFYYKKSIELDPKNFDAHYCLGVLYYNQSMEYYERSQSTIADAAKYKNMWEKPLPEAVKYLEAAHVLEPKDMNTLIVLQNVYSQQSDNDNYLRIKEEIKKLKAGG